MAKNGPDGEKRIQPATSTSNIPNIEERIRNININLKNVHGDRALEQGQDEKKKKMLRKMRACVRECTRVGLDKNIRDWIALCLKTGLKREYAIQSRENENTREDENTREEDAGRRCGNSGQ